MRDVVNNFVLNGRRAKGKGAVTLFPAIQGQNLQHRDITLAFNIFYQN